MSPELLIIVDTEEEFDWDAPFSRANVSTRSIPAQAAAHRLFDRFGVVPTYVIDYPVATDPAAIDFLGRLQEEGKAEIGAHLHPWVTPPHDEEVCRRNSYHSNLPPALERAKLALLTDTIARNFGRRPTVFKGGRNGFGPGTVRALAELGYQVDCSVLPFTDLGEDGGPSFRGAGDQPYWLDDAGGLLEIPLTIGFTGRLAAIGPAAQRLFDSPRARALRIPGLLGRAGLLRRTRLSPEGYGPDELACLLDRLVETGRRTFSLVYHSPSCEPGHTPYVRDADGLGRFLATIETVLDRFARVHGGRFTTPLRVYERMRRARAPAQAESGAGEDPAAAQFAPRAALG
jgi:hypothetical protein